MLDLIALLETAGRSIRSYINNNDDKYKSGKEKKEAIKEFEQFKISLGSWNFDEVTSYPLLSNFFPKNNEAQKDIRGYLFNKNLPNVNLDGRGWEVNIK